MQQRAALTTETVKRRDWAYLRATFCGITLRRVQRRSIDTLCDGTSSNLGCWKLEEARDSILRTSKWYVASRPIVPIMDTRVVPTIFVCGLGGVA